LDKGIYTNLEDDTFYTTQYQAALLKNVENEYGGKHSHVLVIKLESVPNDNLLPSSMAAGSGQSLFEPYDLSSDGE
jgi:hypothetical protein